MVLKLNISISCSDQIAPLQADISKGTMRGTRSVLIWVILIGIMTDSQGAKERPIVTFNPNWAKVFTGESITMMCYITSANQNPRFSWYKDSKQLSVNGQTYTISSTETEHTGNYQCKTTFSEISAISRLEVIYGYLILKVPPFVYEGDDVHMRCYSWPGYSVRRTMFFKDNTMISPLNADIDLVIRNVNKGAAGKYKCVKKSELSSDTSYADESFLYVKDLFSSPEINQTPYPMTQGDNLILTCDTVLSPLRQETELHFAFYKDGQYVQRFSSSNQYEVWSAQLEDIGKYSCEVKTSSSIVRKMSKTIHVQILELFSKPNITATLYPMVEGEPMNLICNTSLSPLRQETELLFAFYRDGQDVQGFSLSDQYEVQSTQPEDSGNYSCEVRTSVNSAKKRSEEINIQVQGGKYRRYELMNIARLVAAFIIYVACCSIIFKYW